MRITRIGDIKCKVGEGPLWDAQEQVLYFVDIRGQQLHRHDPATGAIAGWEMPKLIGSLAVREAGGVIVALEDGFYTFDFESDPMPFARPDNDSTTFNDGKTDRQGRFIAGTASGFANPVASGSLYSLGTDAAVRRIATGLAISNGPCFSPDGSILYCTDSRAQKVFAWDYDTSTGEASNQRVFFDTAGAFEAPTDGATVDAEGHLWLTIVQKSQIGRVTPEGTVDRVIDTPVPWPSSVMFGGPQFDRLYFTSIDGAVYDMPTNEESGGLFVIDDLGVRGVAEHRFAG